MRGAIYYRGLEGFGVNDAGGTWCLTLPQGRPLDDSPVSLPIQAAKDVYGQSSPDEIVVGGYRFKKVGDVDLWTMTTPYVWDARFWRTRKAAHEVRRWAYHWLNRIDRLRRAW